MVMGVHKKSILDSRYYQIPTGVCQGKYNNDLPVKVLGRYNYSSDGPPVEHV